MHHPAALASRGAWRGVEEVASSVWYRKRRPSPAKPDGPLSTALLRQSDANPSRSEFHRSDLQHHAAAYYFTGAKWHEVGEVPQSSLTSAHNVQPKGLAVKEQLGKM